MRFLVILLPALLLSPGVFASELASSDAAVALVDKVMTRVSSGDLRGGMEIAKPYTIVPTAEFDSMVGQAELQMPVMTARFGKSIGHELIRNDSVGQNLIQVIELQRFEKHATVWRFIFYRGSDGWVLNSFKFVDDISSAF
jgi:hypothetical protein